MLDNEPDTNPPTEGSDPSADQPKAAAPRRRRAASRPAGPPAAAEPPAGSDVAAVTEATGAAEHQPALDEALPVKKTARKTAVKRPTKRAAAQAEVPAEVPAAEVAAESEVPAARTRAPRKRAAKKVAAPAAEASADDLVAEASVSAEAPAPLAPPVDEVPSPESATPEAPAAAPVPSEPGPEPGEGAWAGEEAAAEVRSTEVPAALQELADAIARDGQPADSLEEALEKTPGPDLDPQESSLDELEITVDGVQVESAEATASADTPEALEPVDADADADASEDEDEEGDDSESREGDGSRRRRRRRGGRRRRRTGGEEDNADSEDDAESTEAQGPAEDTSAPAEGSTEDNDEDSSESGEEGDGSRRRRRRRRRRGEDAAGAADDPGEVVVRVREPRRGNPKSASSEVTGIEGSTRMEAKRQRRRDGREAGRRRPPILSEAEFLARRESVSRKMIVRQADELSQIAVIEDEILVEHYVDRDSAASLIGNVYLGRVQNVLPSMEAAFIDIGRGRNAVLYAGEVDWDSFGAEGQGRKVERVLKSGQTILVQVTKDPVGAKGARLTNHVSIPGRYIVYAPSGHLSGISRKLPDNERRRLKDILADLIGDASVIVRTAAEGASEEELVRDVNRLKAQWADIEKKVSSGQSPQLLYGEPDLTVRIVRDLFTEDFSELIIQGNGGPNDASVAVESYVSHVAPHLQDRIRSWDPEAEGDLFAAFRLDEQIAKGLERKVFLPSGGSLVIDRTEAMTVIDVNTGKFTGSGGNLEATVTSNNLEAAEEIVRQLRLRDVGGIIVIDFIDMVLPANRELLLRRLVECLGRDRTRHQVAEVTSLGLVQMTRKKIGTGLGEAFTTECPHCHGRGFQTNELPVDSQRQADGGTRDSGRGSRRGGAGGSGGSGGSSSGGPDRGRGEGNGQRQPRPPVLSGPPPEPKRETEAQPSPEPEPTTGVESPAVDAPAEPAAAGAPTEVAAEQPSETEERAPRSRRSGTRRRATREQGAPAPTVADPQAAPAADLEGEPAPSS